MKYSIGEFSALTGIGIHALRYYEKEGLICPGRLANGRRLYSDADVAWIDFIKRLKATDMPIREIQRYAEMRTEGEATLEERLALLETHRGILLGKIAALGDHLENLDAKVKYYRKEIANKRRSRQGRG